MHYKLKDFERDLIDLIELSEEELYKRRDRKQQDYVEMIEDIILPEFKKLLSELQCGTLLSKPKKDRRLASGYWILDGWSFNSELDSKIAVLQKHYFELK